MAKKYYAVKKGRTIGIFQDWETCKASVEGYAGAEYKGFARLEDAGEYLGEKKGAEPKSETKQKSTVKQKPAAKRRRTVELKCGTEQDRERKQTHQIRQDSETEQTTRKRTTPQVAAPEDRPQEGTLLAYVDGSYDHSLKKYAFGCVFILPDGRIKMQYGNGENPQSLQQRNVAGEMLGAMYAVRVAMMSGFSEIEIRYDYEGIEKWVTGAWKAKTELTQKYAAAMRQWGASITLCFVKVVAHSKVYYNEMADRTAKAGLRETDGVPKVCQVEKLRDVAE